jgi:D-alanyl-D-alanine carboxypeptidase
MNEKAIEIGMQNSHFTDPAGLDDEAYSTGEDMLKLVKYSFQYKNIWETTTAETAEVLSADGKINHSIKNTNQLLGAIPGIVGGKTGYTEVALGCMMLVVNVPNYPSQVVSIVLGSLDRFGDTQKLIDWVGAAYSYK